MLLFAFLQGRIEELIIKKVHFIVCGLLEETYGGKKYNTLSNLRLKLDNKKITICIIDKKAELLNELESLGINKAKIYPEIDDVADYIKTHVNIPT